MSFEPKTPPPPSPPQKFLQGKEVHFWAKLIGFGSIYISHVTAVTSFKYAKKRCEWGKPVGNRLFL